jgi:septum formation protein
MIDPDISLPPLVLASRSPRRHELMRRVGLPFRVQSEDIDESHDPHDCPRDTVCRLSKKKGEGIAPLCLGEIVISSDTVVAIDGEVLGKPQSRSQAIAMLTRLSGRWHEVFTGYAFHYQHDAAAPMKQFVDAECTKVRFHELLPHQIESYVRTGEPMDKAGSYGIQDVGALLVHSLQGDYFNVMGFPISQVYRSLLRFARDLG